MTQDELIKLLSGLKGRVSSEVMKTIRRILVLATEYSYLGKQFTFDANATLDANVNRILVELSDAILDDVDTAIMKTVEDEDDSDAVFAYVYRDDNEAKMDYHSSNLKSALEWYLAVCFADKLTNGEILGGVQAYLANPSSYGKDFHFGKGVSIDPIKGMTSLGQQMVNEAWHNGILLGFKKDSRIIGYRVVRGSSYDCPSCDELCVGIHPLYEQVLPNHRNCMCREVPVYANEI